MVRRRSKSVDKTAAVDKVRVLFANAEAMFHDDPKLADRYVRKAVRTAQKARSPIPSELKKRFCRHCGAFWVPSVTVRVRLQKHKVVYYCLKCKNYARYPYVREMKEKRRAKH